MVNFVFDPHLLPQYDASGPRYTSYPTAAQFDERFTADDYLSHLADSNHNFIPAPLSLYVHVPFCRTVCFYCACNKVVTANYGRAEAYLLRVLREARLVARQFDPDRRAVQLHLGGGTPTYFRDREIERLIDGVSEVFSLSATDDREFSVEVDPRTVDSLRIRRLAALGFNRLSLGVQDFNPTVQAAINRKQSVEETGEIMKAARQAGFKSINFDLIYGLPEQTTASFQQTLATVLMMRPDRLAVYNYAHLPQLFKTQRQIDAARIPPRDVKLKILESAIRQITAAGYVCIGLDHFALPEDDLAVALKVGGLHRNFQGYSTRGDCDLVGLGASAISKIGNCYAQNIKDIDLYEHSVDKGELPIAKGVSLSRDDLLRRDVIMSIMCHGKLDFEPVESRHKINFHEYFVQELAALSGFAKDELITIQPSSLHVEPRGRLLLRNVAMVFDAYLNTPRAGDGRYSRLI